MERTHLIFKSDIFDGDELVYEKGKKYLVTDDDDTYWYTGAFAERGIEKSLDAISFFVLTQD